MADSMDSPSPHSRQSTITNERLFNPHVDRRQRISEKKSRLISLRISSLDISASQFNRTESVPSIVSNQYQSRPFIRDTSNTSTDIAMANDAVQLLMTRLGITPRKIDVKDFRFIFPFVSQRNNPNEWKFLLLLVRKVMLKISF